MVYTTKQTVMDIAMNLNRIGNWIADDFDSNLKKIMPKTLWPLEISWHIDLSWYDLIMAKILLNTSQINAVSDFDIDVAKGLMIAGVLGQEFTLTESYIVRILSSIAIMFMSLGFLYFGVQLKRKVKRW